MRLSLVVLVSLCVGSAAAEDLPPAKRAMQLLEKQVDVMRPSGSKDFIATLAADALVLVPDAYVLPKALAEQDSFLDPSEVMLGSAKIRTIVAGGTADAIWAGAELTHSFSQYDCPPALPKCSGSRSLRATELFARSGGVWTAVALHLDDPPPAKADKPDPSSILAPTAAGPLTALLIDPTALAAAIKDDPAVIVLGTETSERAVGTAAAKKLLAGWKKLTFELDGKPTEVRTKTYGYAAATVRWLRKGKPPLAMRATVFAVPGPTDGTWQVVAVHYSIAHRRRL